MDGNVFLTRDFLDLLPSSSDADASLSQNEASNFLSSSPDSSEENSSDSQLLPVPSKKTLKSKRRLHMTKEERMLDDLHHKQCFRLTFSKLGKSDMRRDYVYMYGNVMNSSDPLFVSQFFLQFCTKSCALTDSVAATLYGVPIVRKVGSMAVAAQLSGACEKFPDLICRLQSSRIVRRYNQAGCDVVLTSRFQGTEIVSGEGGSMTEEHDLYLTKTLHLDEDLRIQAITITGSCFNK